MNDSPLVSIIIRTCGKPSVLSHALDSVQRQSYANIEAIIIEDGPNITEEFLKLNYFDLNYHYYSTGNKCGRTVAGNLGLKHSSGKYCNFLDEDDILLEQHVEVMVNTLENITEKVAYSVAEEQQIKVLSLEPYKTKVKRKLIRYKHPFNRLLLCYMNYFPIQCVMFERQLFDTYGGFDEKMDYLEDWDLWLKYALHESFYFVNKITSIYYTVFKSSGKRERDKKLKIAESQIKEHLKHYQVSLSAEQINKDVNYIIHVFNKRNLYFYLKKIQNYLLYRDR